MPADYLAIRDSPAMKRKYRSLALRKKHAAMIANAMRRRRGQPSINAEVAAERKDKSQ